MGKTIFVPMFEFFVKDTTIHGYIGAETLEEACAKLKDIHFPPLDKGPDIEVRATKKHGD